MILKDNANIMIDIQFSFQENENGSTKYIVFDHNYENDLKKNGNQHMLCRYLL